MDKPTKPTNLMPRSFGGVKNNFSASLQTNGYEDGVPAIYGGDNLNYQIDCTGKELDYCEKIVDFMVDLPIGKTITVDANNKLVYENLITDISGKANIDLDNLSTTGEKRVLPNQSGNSGKFLTTNGDNPSWIDIGTNLTPFSINSCNTTNGLADVLYAPGSGTVEAAFTQPTITSSTLGGADYAGVASYTASGSALDAFNGTGIGWHGGQNSADYLIFYAPNGIRATNFLINSSSTTEAMRPLRVLGSLDGVTYDTIVNSFYTTVADTNVSVAPDSPQTQYYKYFKFQSLGYTTRNYIGNITIQGMQLVSVSTADTLYFNVGGTYDNLTATTASGHTFTRASIPSIDVSGYADGTYNGFVLDDSVEFLANTLSYQAKTPTSPNSGDVWLDISKEPLKAYKYDGADWNEYDGVPIGQITVSTGVITSITQPSPNANKYDIKNTRADRAEVMDWGIPDWANAYDNSRQILNNTNFTAPTNGVVIGRVVNSTSSSSYAYVYNASGTLIYQYQYGYINNALLQSDVFIPLLKGYSVKVVSSWNEFYSCDTSGTQRQYGLFVPLKGAN